MKLRCSPRLHTLFLCIYHVPFPLLDSLAGYQPPAEKTIDDIVKTDAEDEALKKYKATLLGSAVAGTGSVVAEPSDPRNVIVKKLALVVEGRPDAEIDLTGDLKDIKKKVEKIFLFQILLIN